MNQKIIDTFDSKIVRAKNGNWLRLILSFAYMN